MERVAISGTWALESEEVFRDVEKVVLEELKKGNVIVTGGALGVDYVATQVALDNGFVEKGQIELYLPISLESFVAHYYKRAGEGVISFEQAKQVCSQLIKVAKINSSSIFDKTDYELANQISYFARNTSIIERCDVLFAFRVNMSKGTTDAISKAKDLGKIVNIKDYNI